MNGQTQKPFSKSQLFKSLVWLSLIAFLSIQLERSQTKRTMYISGKTPKGVVDELVKKLNQNQDGKVYTFRLITTKQGVKMYEIKNN